MNREGVMESLGLIAVLVLFVVGVPAYMYNLLVSRKNQADNAAASIDVYLLQRFDMIPNLVSTVQAYMKHERETLVQLTDLRARAMAGNLSDADKVAMDAQLTSTLSGLRVAMESYPELKANQNFIALQGSINEVEEKIAAARRNFNGSATAYNNSLQMFPTNIIAHLMGLQARPLFEIPAAERQNPNVKQIFAS
jgi:LemA protein